MLVQFGLPDEKQWWKDKALSLGGELRGLLSQCQSRAELLIDSSPDTPLDEAAALMKAKSYVRIKKLVEAALVRQGIADNGVMSTPEWPPSNGKVPTVEPPAFVPSVGKPRKKPRLIAKSDIEFLDSAGIPPRQTGKVVVPKKGKMTGKAAASPQVTKNGKTAKRRAEGSS